MINTALICAIFLCSVNAASLLLPRVLARRSFPKFNHFSRLNFHSKQYTDSPLDPLITEFMDMLAHLNPNEDSLRAFKQSNTIADSFKRKEPKCLELRCGLAQINLAGKVQYLEDKMYPSKKPFDRIDSFVTCQVIKLTRPPLLHPGGRKLLQTIKKLIDDQQALAQSGYVDYGLLLHYHSSDSPYMLLQDYLQYSRMNHVQKREFLDLLMQ